MTLMLVPETRRSRRSIERWGALSGAGAALAIFAAVVAITTTVGTESMRLPQGHRATCDGSLVVDYPVLRPAAPAACRLVRAL